MNTLDHYAAIIGIDWADRKHDLCLQLTGSDELEYSVLPHQAQAIGDWANGLHQRFPDGPIAICIELRRVPLILPCSSIPSSSCIQSTHRSWPGIVAP